MHKQYLNRRKSRGKFGRIGCQISGSDLQRGEASSILICSEKIYFSVYSKLFIFCHAYLKIACELNSSQQKMGCSFLF